MTQAPFDPLALWRDTLVKWQAAISETAAKGMAPADLSRFMNQSMGMSLQLQQALGMMMGKYLAALNMPTRAELAAMDARLTSIEGQLARLAQHAADASAEPSPADMNARLTSIEDQLARLASAATTSAEASSTAVNAHLAAIESKLAHLARQVATAGAGPAPAAADAALPCDAKPVRGKRSPQRSHSQALEPAAPASAAADPVRSSRPPRRAGKKQVAAS